MARAKRTHRAEARRRFRQTQLELAQETEEAEEPEDGEEPAPAARPSSSPRAGRPATIRAAATRAAGPAPRPGVFSAFRAAATTADIRADLRALPSLLRTRAVLVPGALIVAAVVVTFALAGNRELVAALMFQALLAPPPMAASFLAGILTDRAAWLLGGLAGLAAGIAFALVMLVAPDAVILGLFRADAAIPAGFRESYAVQALAVSPLMGIGTGAFAGFYRRFLRMANPQQNRQQNRQAKRPADRGRRAPTRR